MDQPYILQHKNTAAAVLMIDETGDITDIGDAVNKPYLPVLCSETISLKTWWSNRTIPVTRQGISEDLMGERISSTKELLLRNLGLSLTDCYWVKPLGSDYTWEQPDIIDIKKLPKPQELYALLKKDAFIPDLHRQEICEAYEGKINLYIDFMNGAPVWEYQYRT